MNIHVVRRGKGWAVLEEGESKPLYSSPDRRGALVFAHSYVTARPVGLYVEGRMERAADRDLTEERDDGNA